METTGKYCRAAVLLVICASVANGEVFYWKGGTSGYPGYGNPANWDAGSDGGGNAGGLVPGAADEIFGARSANWDLGGETWAVGKWDSELNASGGSDWTRYYINITNGTLTVNRRVSHSDTIYVWGNTSLIFPEGSTYIPSQSTGAAEQIFVNALGHLEIKGAFSPYRIALSTARYGYALIDPSSFSIAGGTIQTSTFSIAGTNEFPHGLVWAGGGNAACRLDMTIAWSGRMIAAGDFSRNGKPGTFTLTLSGGGSKIETCGDLSFSGVDECNVTHNAEFTANAGHTLDISNFRFYEEGGITYKLGAGVLAIGESLPPAMQVNAGTIAVRAVRSDLAGMRFAGNGITVRFDVAGCRLDGLDDNAQLSRVTFASGIDMSGMSSGITLFSSANESILSSMKACLESSVPEGFSIGKRDDSLLLVDDSEIVFDASAFSDLSDPEAWGGEVPVGRAVTLRGAGVVPFTASSPLFSKITVADGATLSIEGGTDDDPVTPPPLAMAYSGKIVCTAHSCVRLTNEVAGVATFSSIPVFEIATNAVLYAIAPEHETKGFTFTNLKLNFFGTINLPDAVNHSTPCITLGTAAADGTAYFGLDVDGGTLNVTNRVATWQGNASLIRIMCPEAGGAVYPAGEFKWRNFVKMPESIEVGNTPILANSGYHIGVNNPPSIPFTLNVSGTPIGLNGTSMFAGGANIVCTGADSGLVKGDEFINYTLTQYVTVTDAAKITLRDGALFSNAFVAGSQGMVYFTPANSGHVSLEVDGGRMEFYRLPAGGTRTAKVLVHDGCYDVGRLIPESVSQPETGWRGAVYSPVFNWFAQIEVSGLLQIRGTDAFNRPSWWHFDGYWDHVISQTDMPFAGSGSILVTNTTERNSMTFTLVNRGNTMTGTISAAPGTRSTLLFKDDCMWSGTVVANGCARCVNTDPATGEERPAHVKFANMRLEEDFPIRLWSAGGVATNDFIELSACVDAGGAFVGEPMDGRRPHAGDAYVFASYPADSELPSSSSTRWRLSSIPSAEGSGKVMLVLTYHVPGTSLVIR